MRILPHHQDTGGFFVAVLEKVKALPWESESNSTSNLDGDEKNEKNDSEDKKNSPVQPRKRRRIQGYREDPFVFFKDENEDVWPSIK